MGARNATDYVAMEAAFAGFRWLPIEAADWARVRDVHRALAKTGPGRQRSVRLPELIAAVAERHGIAIVHFDEDYDRIAAITGQPTRWVAPRGSVAAITGRGRRAPRMSSAVLIERARRPG